MKESIFKETVYEDAVRSMKALNGRNPDDVYDDASDILEFIKHLNPLEYVRWFMLVGYSEAKAIELLKRELCGEQSVYVLDIEDNTKSGFVSTGYSIGLTFKEDELFEPDHWYYVVPVGEYKPEATFETYGEAREYANANN
jgi:hypothetical protein